MDAQDIRISLSQEIQQDNGQFVIIECETGFSQMQWILLRKATLPNDSPAKAYTQNNVICVFDNHHFLHSHNLH